MVESMILAKKSKMRYYKIPLYTKAQDGHFMLYKPEGLLLKSMRVGSGRYPSELYLSSEDKMRGIQEVQKAFNKELRESIKGGEASVVKDMIVSVVEETLTEPRSGSLEGIAETVNILSTECANQPGVLRALANVSFTDYTTALHSVNVMALTLGLCLFSGFDQKLLNAFGLAALLHDVGKTKVDPGIIGASRKLTTAEFEEIKKHPALGFDILSECDFEGDTTGLGALEHHEKLDGSGYPRGTKAISQVGQIIGIVDCYEAITNDDRPYRSAMDPLDALSLLKRDVENGKYSMELFKKFAYSLTK
ncbi:HD domain-containing protein [bacterium]|nr:HD domain-containing protein [bacterium]